MPRPEQTVWTSLATVVVVAASAVASAEPPVRVDVGMSFARSRVEDRRGGSLLVEIKSMVTDEVALGGRVDFALMFGGRAREDVDLDFALAACGLVDAELFLTSGAVRPFVGFGVGAYTIGSQTVGNQDATARIESATGTYLGVAPQIGLDVGRVRLSATYNAVLGADLALRDVATGAVLREVSQSYGALELGFRFGEARARR